MAQVKVYALCETLEQHRQQLSDAIHKSIMDALSYPPEKRFIALDPADFIFPADRSNNYLIIEISMFEGRSIEAKKALIRGLFANISESCGIAPNDIEITLLETPKET
ncbi:MAG: tautomerase family protein [Deinococcota bacterium]